MNFYRIERTILTMLLVLLPLSVKAEESLVCPCWEDLNEDSLSIFFEDALERDDETHCTRGAHVVGIGATTTETDGYVTFFNGNQYLCGYHMEQPWNGLEISPEEYTTCREGLEKIFLALHSEALCTKLKDPSLAQETSE